MTLPSAEGLNVLISAYACRPNAGTEPGIGWNWVIHMADECGSVHVLTAGRNRKAVTAYLEEHPRGNLHFHFMDVPGMDEMSAGAKHYLRWQWLAFQLSKRLRRNVAFDIVHHVSYGSVHLPTFLCWLGVPTIFGPVGGGQTTPNSLLPYFGDQAGSERRRTGLTKLLPWIPFYRLCMGRMALVLAANSDTLDLARRSGAHKVALMCDTGLREDFASDAPRTFCDGAGIRLLWVGRLLPRKGVELALDALQRTPANISLTFVGDGRSEAEMRREIANRGLEQRVFWSGKRASWSEVREAYLSHDALLFTSVRDSFGSQLLEAMSVGLPIVALSQSGARDFVPSDAGIKVNVHDTAQSTVEALAEGITRFAESSVEARNAFSKNAWIASKNFAWVERARTAATYYRELVKPQ